MEIIGNWKKYDGKTYYLPDGKEFTPDDMRTKYPASYVEDMAIQVMGVTLLKVETVTCIRAEYKIPSDMSDEEAFIKMGMIDVDNATKSTPLERIAASLEYLCMIFSQGGSQ